ASGRRFSDGKNRRPEAAATTTTRRYLTYARTISPMMRTITGAQNCASVSIGFKNDHFMDCSC
ncbi:MAG: hypothetical protein KGM47_18860, partial [Acidobacteriota bacterium]|nr:hypothetical protein [Acidobacteriota bacterium]